MGLGEGEGFKDCGCDTVYLGQTQKDCKVEVAKLTKVETVSFSGILWQFCSNQAGFRVAALLNKIYV